MLRSKRFSTLLASLLLAANLNSQEHTTRWRIVVEFTAPKGVSVGAPWIEACRAAEMVIVSSGMGEPGRCALEGKGAKGWPR